MVRWLFLSALFIIGRIGMGDCVNLAWGDVYYQSAASVEAPEFPIPEGKRVPLGWRAAAIPPSASDAVLILRFDSFPQSAQPHRLRFTVGLDHREEQLIEARTLETEQTVGVFDVRYGFVFQPFEIELDAAAAAAIEREGVSLRILDGEGPLFILTGSNGRISIPEEMLPHIMQARDSDPMEQFYERMTSLASLQQFGWMDGCVLDGLVDLRSVTGDPRFDEIIQAHWTAFIDPQGRLVYEDPRSGIRENVYYGIEGTHPLAALALDYPWHPAVDEVIAFWLRLRREDEAITGGSGTATAEGCITIAHPMAAIARARGDDELARIAIEVLRTRKQRLADGDDLHLRRHRDGSVSFTNWARGASWYLLGFIRVIQHLEDRFEMADIRAEFARIAAILLEHQREDGLWNCYFDDPEGSPDTSGSAGIAAAFMLGFQQGILPKQFVEAAQKTHGALQGYLTPDGYLTGVAQSNRGGEILQRSDYRVLAQFGMGLFAQLDAAMQAIHLDNTDE